MTIRDQIGAAITQAFGSDYLGQEVEYNGVPVQAIFHEGEDPDSTKSGSSAKAVLSVRVLDVSTWSVNDLVSVDGELWKVKRASARQFNTSTWYKHVLELERDRRMRP
jgi:hypothetical protein